MSAAGSRTSGSSPLAPGARVSPGAAGASGAPSLAGPGALLPGLGGCSLMAPRTLGGFPWSACVRIAGRFLKSARAGPAWHRGCAAAGPGHLHCPRTAGGGAGAGPAGAPGSETREPRILPALRGQVAPACPGGLPARPARQRTPEGQPASPTPEAQARACFPNMTAFLPRRTRFWSVILRATKLRSPPCTSVPTANNSVSFSLCFLFVTGKRSAVGASPAAHAGPRESRRGGRAGGAAGSPWAPSRRRAAPGPRLFAPEPPGGARGAGGPVGAGGRGAGGREFVKSCEAREEVRRGRSRRRRWPAVLGGPGKPGGGRGAEGPRERRVPVGSARPPEPRAQRRPAAPARRPGGRARARP